MYTYSVLLILAFFVAVVLTPFAGRVAVRLGAVDYPDERKIHAAPTPRLGGAAIFLAIFLPQAGILFLGNRISAAFEAEALRILTLIGASTVIFLLGVWDDVRGLKAPVKLGVQVIAAALLVLGGWRIMHFSNPFGSPVDLGILAGPVTVIWLVAITNAMNFVDGIDGAAAGIGAIAAFAVANGSSPEAAIVTWATASCVMGACLGFLFHNFHPARVFMGDSGSTLLGFVLAAMAIISTQKSTAALALAVPVAALALPIAEIVLTVVRRLVGKQPLMSADNLHLHHRLMALGFGQRNAALALYGLAALGSLVAITMAHSARETGLFAAAFLVLFLGAVFKGIGALGGEKPEAEHK